MGSTCKMEITAAEPTTTRIGIEISSARNSSQRRVIVTVAEQADASNSRSKTGARRSKVANWLRHRSRVTRARVGASALARVINQSRVRRAIRAGMASTMAATQAIVAISTDA